MAERFNKEGYYKEVYSAVQRCSFVIKKHETAYGAFKEFEDRIIELYSRSNNEGNDILSMHTTMAAEIEIMVVRVFIRCYNRTKTFPFHFPYMEHTMEQMHEKGIKVLSHIKTIIK